uniref:peptidylprolyl isomerase n=1 Tax=Entomoneis paludosa TaxID=265537 RepID=A0A7S2YE37_9STRA|mmetsp:Transcript_29180/g.61046  ORF Transcript_29180/g.61046 Transcript_29180/m.61046 type:complete len:185 (+) Transcript_29180:145-699(+)
MKLAYSLASAAAVALVGSVSAYSVGDKPSTTGAVQRRAFIHQVASTALVTGSALLSPQVTHAEDGSGEDWVTTESGLKYKVLKEGTGAVPEPGQMVKAHYTGWLDDFDSPKKFDSSRDRGRPFSFKVGAGQVIRGWDESFSSMKVGERRQIILPPRLGYGDRGAGGIIPGGATLYFDVELLNIV